VLSAQTLYTQAYVTIQGNKLQGDLTLDLQPGENTIELIVTHLNGLSRTYKVTVQRKVNVSMPPREPESSQTKDFPISLSDIAGNWAESDIHNAVAAGWVGGYPDGTFHPEREITRAEFVQLLAKALRWIQPDVQEPLPEYTDIDDIGLWSRPAISAAVRLGLIDGYADGSFGPDRSLTRAEMTVMIARA
jgi:hypothetical protein